MPKPARAAATRPTRSKARQTKAVLRLTPEAPLLLEDVVGVARLNRRVELTPRSLAAMKRGRAIVESCLSDGEAHYGINTGFGSLSKQRIGPKDLETLQRNLVRSHAAGVGTPLPTEIVRGMMLLLASSLGRGFSGVRPGVTQAILELLNRGVTPVVPEIGSVGASGDLAPLSAIATVLIGEGRATCAGREMTGARALASAGIKPITLQAKEGLALINGTHLMAAEGALLVHDASALARAAHVALGMSIDACRASHSYLDPRLYQARNQIGPAFSAEVLRRLLAGSQIVKSHVENDPRVQDPYSLRAAPTVLGAADFAITHVHQCITHELGAVTDNPLVFPKASIPYMGQRIDSPTEAIISGANFHGMPLAIPLDILAISLCHIAGISERRTYLITGAFEPESNLKPFLAPRPGLQSGFMIAQYTAAACINEMVGLANPASVANVTTCAGMEDYNSFGPRSAAKARRSLDLARKVVAIEMLCAAEGLECHRPLKSGRAIERAHAIIRARVPRLTEDRSPSDDIAAIESLIATGAFDDVVR